MFRLASIFNKVDVNVISSSNINEMYTMFHENKLFTILRNYSKKVNF